MTDTTTTIRPGRALERWRERRDFRRAVRATLHGLPVVPPPSQREELEITLLIATPSTTAPMGSPVLPRRRGRWASRLHPHQGRGGTPR